MWTREEEGRGRNKVLGRLLDGRSVSEVEKSRKDSGRWRSEETSRFVKLGISIGLS